MAYVVESGLPDLLSQLGTEVHDLTLTESADGVHVSRTWAGRVLGTAVREVFRRLRKEHVEPLRFKQELSPTVDSSDSELYPLNRRVRQIIRVFDYTSSTSERDYWPLGTYDVADEGWVLEPDGLRLREATVGGTLKVWAVQTPVRMSYGTAAGGGASSITLATSPTVGISSVEPNYYVGARIGIESGNGVGEIRRVTAYSASAKACTVAAWSTAPDSSSTYSIMCDLPDCMARAVVLRAALIILRTDAVMDRQMDDVAASYLEAYESGKAVLKGGKVSFTPRFREVADLGFGDLR